MLAILIILRVVVSWYSPRPTNILVRILHRLTEPLLAPLRRIIPRVGPLDFFPTGSRYTNLANLLLVTIAVKTSQSQIF